MPKRKGGFGFAFGQPARKDLSPSDDVKHGANSEVKGGFDISFGGAKR